MGTPKQERGSRVSRLDPVKLQELVAAELQESFKRIEQKITPLLEEELAFLSVRYPELQGVAIGNGDWFFRFTPGSRYASLDRYALPPDFQCITQALDYVCDWRGTYQLVDDLKPTVKLAKSTKAKKA